jgi:hypothetical protein
MGQSRQIEAVRANAIPLSKRVRPGLLGSWEELFYQAGQPAFLLNLLGRRPAPGEPTGERLEHAIGVIYRPETEPKHFHRISDTR